jgi:hypothetical protein
MKKRMKKKERKEVNKKRNEKKIWIIYHDSYKYFNQPCKRNPSQTPFLYYYLQMQMNTLMVYIE